MAIHTELLKTAISSSSLYFSTLADFSLLYIFTVLHFFTSPSSTMPPPFPRSKIILHSPFPHKHYSMAIHTDLLKTTISSSSLYFSTLVIDIAFSCLCPCVVISIHEFHNGGPLGQSGNESHQSEASKASVTKTIQNKSKRRHAT